MVFNDSMYLLGNCRRLQLHASTYQEQHLSCVCYDKAVCCALGYKEHLRSLPSNIRVLHLPLPTMTLLTRLQHLVCYTVKIIQITKIYFCYCLLLFALCFISDQHSMFRRQEAGSRGEINYPFHMFTPNQFLHGRTSSFGSEVEVKEGEESQKRHSELTQQLQQHQQHQQQQQGQGHGQGHGDV